MTDTKKLFSDAIAHEHGRAHEHERDPGHGDHGDPDSKSGFGGEHGVVRDPLKKRGEESEKRTEKDIKGDGEDVPTFGHGDGRETDARTESDPADLVSQEPTPMPDGGRDRGVEGDPRWWQGKDIAPGTSVEMSDFGPGSDAASGPDDLGIDQAMFAGGQGDTVLGPNGEYENCTTMLGGTPEGGDPPVDTGVYGGVEDLIGNQDPDPSENQDPDPSKKDDKNDDESGWSKGQKGAAWVFGILALLVTTGFTVWGGARRGWWGAFWETDTFGPQLADRSSPNQPRDENGALTVVKIPLLAEDQMVVTDDSNLDASTVRFFLSLTSASTASREGEETLDVPGGTWSSEADADGRNILLVFTPDGTSSANPLDVWVKVKNIQGIRSNAAKISLTYVPAMVTTTDTGGTGGPKVEVPKAANVVVNDKRYDNAFFVDLTESITKGTDDVAFGTLVLVDGQGKDVLSLDFGGKSKWAVETSDTKAQLSFKPETSFGGGTQTLSYRVFDTKMRPSNTATVTANFITPPIFAPFQVGVGDLEVNQLVKVNVMSGVIPGSADVVPSTLVLKGIVKRNSATADAVFDPADAVRYGNGELRGYTKMVVPGEGTWEVIEEGGTFKIGFTLTNADFTDASVAIIAVADSDGNESPDGRIHISEIYQALADAISAMVDKPDAEFWADFRTRVCENDKVDLGVMSSVMAEIRRVLDRQAREQGQLNSRDATLTFPTATALAAVRDNWMNSGDKSDLLDQTLAFITFEETGDAAEYQERSYWNRRVRMRTMQTMVQEYFVFMRANM